MVLLFDTRGDGRTYVSSRQVCTGPHSTPGGVRDRNITSVFA